MKHCTGIVCVNELDDGKLYGINKIQILLVIITKRIIFAYENNIFLSHFIPNKKLYFVIEFVLLCELEKA